MDQNTLSRCWTKFFDPSHSVILWALLKVLIILFHFILVANIVLPRYLNSVTNVKVFAGLTVRFKQPLLLCQSSLGSGYQLLFASNRLLCGKNTSQVFTQNTASLTQRQQLCRDSFTDTGPSTRDYRHFMVEQARSENTGRRHTCFFSLRKKSATLRPLLDFCGLTHHRCFLQGLIFLINIEHIC